MGRQISLRSKNGGSRSWEVVSLLCGKKKRGRGRVFEQNDRKKFYIDVGQFRYVKSLCSSKARPPWPNLWFIMVYKKVWGVLFIIVSGELSQLWKSIFRAKGVYDVSWYKMYHHQKRKRSKSVSGRNPFDV